MGVATGRLTPKRKVDEMAHYDHEMVNVFTGKVKTVESKFNNAKLTENQLLAKPNVQTSGGLIIDRTTSSGLGQAVNAYIVGTGSAGVAQTNRK